MILRPVHPNAGIEAEFQRKLQAIIDEMHKSVAFWLRASYRRHEPEMAHDEIPASALRGAIRKLVQRWQKRFDEMAPDLADHFSKLIGKRSDAALRSILKKGGMS